MLKTAPAGVKKVPRWFCCAVILRCPKVEPLLPAPTHAGFFGLFTIMCRSNPSDLNSLEDAVPFFLPPFLFFLNFFLIDGDVFWFKFASNTGGESTFCWFPFLWFLRGEPTVSFQPFSRASRSFLCNSYSARTWRTVSPPSPSLSSLSQTTRIIFNRARGVEGCFCFSELVFVGLLLRLLLSELRLMLFRPLRMSWQPLHLHPSCCACDG